MRKKRLIRKSVVEPQGKLPGDSRIGADEIERTRYDIMLARLESLRHGSLGRGGVEADEEDVAEDGDDAMVSESLEAFSSLTFADSAEGGGGMVDDDGRGGEAEAEDAFAAEADDSCDGEVSGDDADVEGGIAGGDGGTFGEKTSERFVVSKQLLNAESADVMLMRDIIIEIVLSDINGHLTRQPS